ncbi:MAG: DUF5655 domain-containing protein [Patescibacteria group bacterium]|jgi:predicted transport protein
MPIFKIENNKFKALKSESFKSELELQTLVDNNLKEIFGLEFLRTEFGGQGLSIDTIAYDSETKGPVLIEYKKDSHESVIDQGMAYLSWLLNHKGDYQIVLESKIGKKEIDWSQARVIFIARSFNTHQTNALGFKGVPFELWKYDWSNDIFQIQQIETPKSDISISSILKTKPVKEVSREIQEYTIADHLSRVSGNVKTLFEEMHERIINLDSRIQAKPVKNYIGYKVQYHNFCSLNLSKEKIRVYVRSTKIDDPKKIFKKVPANYKWGTTALWYHDFVNNANADYIMSVIKQGYDNAPDR